MTLRLALSVARDHPPQSMTRVKAWDGAVG